MLRLLGQLGGLVLGQATLEHRAREDADEPAVLDHRNPLEVVLLEEPERLVDVHVRADRVVRRLDDAFDRVWDLAAEKSLTLRDAALVAAILEVSAALEARGIYP